MKILSVVTAKKLARLVRALALTQTRPRTCRLVPLLSTIALLESAMGLVIPNNCRRNIGLMSTMLLILLRLVWR